MMATGNLRARFTHLDNAPDGRKNWGWASLNAWYLAALAKIWSLATGLTPSAALLASASWSNPILYGLALFTILLVGLTTNKLPAAAAAVFVFGTSPRVYDDFSYALPGHHGWHDLACFAALVSLAAGMRKKNSARWFALAGLAAAIAFWIGATQQAFGIAAAICGALAAMMMTARRGAEVDFPAPESWRLFGLTAGAASLAFYFLEYAPGPFAMRLEVNHPLYALAFSLGGEFLCRTQRLLLRPEIRKQTDCWWMLATGAALIGIAAAVFFGPPAWHAMRQPMMQRLHHEIAEFQSVVHWYHAQWILMLGTPLAFFAVAVWRICSRRLTMRNRAALLVCVCPCGVTIALSFLQLRWAGIAGASAAAVAAVLFADFDGARVKPIESDGERRPLWLPETFCVCCSLVLAICWTIFHHGASAKEIEALAIDRLATMEVAHILQANSKVPLPIAVFSDQKERQAWTDYSAGIRSVGSLYWENGDGVRDEAQFFADYDVESAHRIARERGINFVVVTPNAGSVVAYHYVFQGNKNAPGIRQTLAYRLAAPNPTPPAWLELLPTSSPAMRRERIRIYRVL